MRCSARKASFFSVPKLGSSKKLTVGLIPGEGIGPEVAQATRDVVAAVGAPVNWHKITGEESFSKGFPAVFKANSFSESLEKGLKEQFNLFAKLVFAKSLPGVKGPFEHLELTLIQDYSLESQVKELSENQVQTTSFVSESAFERIAKYSFEFAIMNKHKKVTAVHEFPLESSADSLFLGAMRAQAELHSEIDYEEVYLEKLCSSLVSNPSNYDLLVSPSIDGNVLENLLSWIVGGPGIAPGAKLGNTVVFGQASEHLAKDIAGKAFANPTSSILASVLMMRYLGFHSHAFKVLEALKTTYEKTSTRTPDLGGGATTYQFANTVIRNIK